MRWFAALVLICLAAAAAADERLAQARHEGEVVWYTAMNVPDTEALKKPFLARYPFLALTVVRAPGEKVRNRILIEARANRHTWDVVSFNLLDIDALEREGLLAPKSAAAIYVRQYVIGYNTRDVKQPPRSWGELLAPEWRGKLAIDESDVEWYAAMLDYWGREKGMAYMRALARQQPQQRRGHQLLTRLLVAGDFPLALVHAAEIDKERQDGAPVDWVKTLDPVITSPSQVAIAAKAPHPAAARLFADFLLSDDGQRAIASRGRVPANLAGAAQLKVHFVSARLAPDFNRYEREFRDIFGRAP